jgi:hypothetical protein
LRGERFVRYLGANVGLYIAWAFLWGVPAIAGLGAAAAAWIAVTAAVGIVQPLPAGIRTDVAFAVSEDGRTAHYRLRCEYDRAGRIRRAVPGPDAHPGGMRACWTHRRRAMRRGLLRRRRGQPPDSARSG